MEPQIFGHQYKKTNILSQFYEITTICIIIANHNFFSFDPHVGNHWLLEAHMANVWDQTKRFWCSDRKVVWFSISKLVLKVVILLNRRQNSCSL